MQMFKHVNIFGFPEFHKRLLASRQSSGSWVQVSWQSVTKRNDASRKQVVRWQSVTKVLLQVVAFSTRLSGSRVKRVWAT